MFSGLRRRLTALYLLVALATIGLVGGGAYWLLETAFQTATDLAMRHRMASEFRGLGAPLPPDLAAAEQAWATRRAEPMLPLPPWGQPGPDPTPGAREEAPDGTLVSIFVLPLNEKGRLLFDPNPVEAPMTPDRSAVAAALTQGHDRRTVALENGTRVRLLTYRLTRADGPAVLQVGRALTDQDQVLAELLTELLAVGGLAALGLGAGSWWLAGRTLVPAQAAWGRQQTFVANASHELRTPLTLIRASTEVALRGLPADDPRRPLLSDVLAECDHTSHLIDDLLLLSRLDAGHLPVARETVDLPTLLADVQRQMGRLASERDVHLSLGAVAGTVVADATRLRQVLLILVDNALRHTPPQGAVWLAAEPRGPQARLTVTDSGHGIAPTHLPHVFDRFYRADPARGHDQGAGLGLAIARGLVEAQGGQIRLTSTLGVGTQVTLLLPAAAPPRRALADHEVVPLRPDHAARS